MKKRAHLVKISRPMATSVLLRNRLFRFLERAAATPIVWVSGPAGSGKTTLITSYLSSEDLPCLWYQCDEGDGDEAAFFYYMGLAVKKAAPRIRRPMPLLTPEYSQGVTTFAARYFEDLFDRLKSPFVLVFDNYQEVPRDSLLHRLLAVALSGIPPGGRVILISRQGPAPELSKFIASRSMALIGWDDLRFTLSESRRVVKLWEGARLSGETVKRMHELTQGWVAGLILLSQQKNVHGDPRRFLADHPPQEVFDYFANEVFGKIDETTRDFLLKTALLPSFTSEMAEDLTGHPYARQILTSLTRSNHFTETRHELDVSYQYHPLYRAYLWSRASECFTSADMQALQKRAAELLEGCGQVENALDLYRQAGEWEGLIRIILTKGPELIGQGMNQTLLNWLKSLPRDLLDSTPWVLYWMGVALLPFDPVQGREWCEKAYSLFKAEKDPVGLFLCWSAIVDSFFMFERDNAGPLYRWIEELEDLMREFPQMPSPEVDARVAMSMFASLAWYRPSHAGITRWEEKNLALMQHCKGVDHKIMIGNWLMLYYFYKGDMAKMEMVLRSLRPITRHVTVAPFTRIVLELLESYLQHIKGDRDACLKALEKGTETSRESGVHVLDFFLFASHVNISLAYGDLSSARANLENMAAVMNRKSNNDVGHYHHSAAFEAFCRRDFVLARQYVETALHYAIESGTEHHVAFCRIALAQVLFEVGDREHAELELAQAMEINERMDSRIIEYMCLTVQASIALRLGDMAVSRSCLSRAFGMGREKGVMSPHFQVPFVLAELCAHALDQGIEVEYVQGLIRKFRLPSQYALVGCEKWPWPLKISSLGGFSVARDGKLLEFPVKAQKKPLEMLKVLVSFGERGMSEEQASDVLWPDADGERAHQSFAVTLHRLRKLLGVEEAVRLRDGRLALDHHHLWVDAWAFERFAKQADESFRAGEKAKGLEYCERAVHLHQGPFLGGNSVELWADSYEKRLRSKLLRCVDMLGAHLEECGKWDEALEQYTKGLEADELAERLYQRLMHCLGKMGRTAEMLAVYERCKSTLMKHLGTAPSPETETLRRSLASNREPETGRVVRVDFGTPRRH